MKWKAEEEGPRDQNFRLQVGLQGCALLGAKSLSLIVSVVAARGGAVSGRMIDPRDLGN